MSYPETEDTFGQHALVQPRCLAQCIIHACLPAVAVRLESLDNIGIEAQHHRLLGICGTRAPDAPGKRTVRLCIRIGSRRCGDGRVLFRRYRFRGSLGSIEKSFSRQAFLFAISHRNECSLQGLPLGILVTDRRPWPFPENARCRNLFSTLFRCIRHILCFLPWWRGATKLRGHFHLA